MPLRDDDMRRAAALVAAMRAMTEELYADDGEMPVEEAADLWAKYFEAQTELEQLIPPAGELVDGLLI